MRMYIIQGEEYTSEDLRRAYETLTGISYDDDIYNKPLTDTEIYEYLLNSLED